MSSQYICDPDFSNIRPCEDLHEWGRWMTKKTRHVARTDIEGKGFVSTVFLGLDHDHVWFHKQPNPMPLIFETMIFAPGYYCDQDQQRYRTVEAARAGHDACVTRLEQAQKKLFA